MTNSEMVEKIVNRTGITAEQAEDALQKHDGDLLEAMIYVEQTYSQNKESGSSFSTNQVSDENNPVEEQASQNFSGDGKFNIDEEKQPCGNCGSERSFGKTLKYLIGLSLNNSISIIHNGNEVVTLPIIVLIVLLFSSMSAVLMVMLISMFFDIKYCFKGDELGNDRFNSVLLGIYDFVQNLKSILIK